MSVSAENADTATHAASLLSILAYECYYERSDSETHDEALAVIAELRDQFGATAKACECPWCKGQVPKDRP